MPVYKISVYFEYQTAGWSEVYFCTADTPTAACAITNGNRDKILAPRMAGCLLKAIRAVENYNPRVGKLNPIGFFRPPLVSGDIGFPGDKGPDVTSTAAYCRLAGVTGPSRPIFFRGLRDALIVRNTDGTPFFGSWTSFADNLLAWMKSGSPYQIRATAPASQANCRKFKVLGVTQISPGRCALRLSAADYGEMEGTKNQAWNGALDSKILVAGGSTDMHNFPGLKGEFLVLLWDTAGKTIHVSYDLPFAIAGEQEPMKLTVRNLRYTFANIDALTSVDFRSRDTGRPTNLRRGRSRPVMRRH
jgi:hypothetical protein